MHFSDSSKSNDTTESSKASTSMDRILSYWQYYHRKNFTFFGELYSFVITGVYFLSIIKSSLLSSNHYHLPITSSSQHHYYHQIIIILPSHHHPQLVKITSLITSAGKHYISWKVLKPRREKKGVRL